MALLVLDVTPKAMRRLVNSCNNVSTVETIRNLYRNLPQDTRNKEFNKGLNKNEKEMLNNLGKGFINCDTSFLYKVIRHHQLVPSPTHGWSGKVDQIKNYGDLVETLRQIRNLVVHLPNIRLAEDELCNLKTNIFQTIATVSILCENEENLIGEMKSHIEWPRSNRLA
ncbi:unnamed protein product [Mytilus coruscus]|uniref:DZIP3-like HEPN domain-containing protein n=1 Tax=Mytilus coruscus TaxID=42192 RepID=A0A6J8DUA6_MYTCO|nr:unnamed protein product [Mytilus coruscus]